jgi:hypothetical protein
MRPPARPLAIVCDAEALPPTAETVDLLARAELAARRAGTRMHLVNASEELGELLGLAGLRDALGVEVKRQPEQREERGGVEEEGDVGDPPL